MLDKRGANAEGLGMMWDFRNLIRRGGGVWPRDWRESSRKLSRPPSDKTSEDNSQKSADRDKRPDEQWLTSPWQPAPGSADAWKEEE
jgi:hypothetical protein